jgi:hypothetical protein
MYGLCICTPAYYIDGRMGSTPSGGDLLLMGWLGILQGIFAWLANPLLFFAWITYGFGAYSVALVFAGFAILFVLSFFSVQQILVNEAGNYANITHYGVGYWLWLMSTVATFTGSLKNYLEINQEIKEPEASPPE